MSDSLATASGTPISKFKPLLGQVSEQFASLANPLCSDFQFYLQRILGKITGASPPEIGEVDSISASSPVMNTDSVQNATNSPTGNSSIPALIASLKASNNFNDSATRQIMDNFQSLAIQNSDSKVQSKPLQDDAALVANSEGNVRTNKVRDLSPQLLARIEEKDLRLRQLATLAQNQPGFWQKIQDHFQDLNFVPNPTFAPPRIDKSDLLQELQHLKNIPSTPHLDFLKSDIWVQQIWPLQENASIFNPGEKNSIPCDADKLTSKTPDRSILQESGQNSESPASSLDSENQSSDLNITSAGLPKVNFPQFPDSDNPPFYSVPEGEKFFEQLLDKMRFNLEQGNYRMSLEFEPEHLGRLLMNVSLQGDELKARFLVDNDAAQELIASKMDDLKEALNSHGISVKNLEVKVDRSDRIDHPEVDTLSQILPDKNYQSALKSAYLSPETAYLPNVWVV